MSSLQFPVIERTRAARSLDVERDGARPLRVLPHEIGFFTLYSLVLFRLLASPNVAWAEIAIWLAFTTISALLIALTRAFDTSWAWRTRLGAYVIIMNAVYFRMGPVVAATGTLGHDAALQHIDTLLFGQPLPMYFDVTHVLASELLSACYFLLFPYILLSCGRQVVRYESSPTEARAFFSGFFLIYAMGFVGYLLVPARGPWLDMPGAFTHDIAGRWMTALNQWVVARNSNRVDVFPSLHVAASTFMLLFDRRFAPGRYRAYLPAAVGLWISTLYLRFHYGIDVIAGVLVAVLGLRVAFAMTHHFQLFSRGIHR